MTTLLEVDGIGKAFVGVTVLSDVSMRLEKGRVHGIVGENGAGKSTLMKILAGIYQPDAGTMRLEGAAFEPRNPRAAIDAGMIVIHQELSLFPDQTVAENIFAGGLPAGRSGVVQRRRLQQAAARVLAEVGLDVSPSARVRSLSLAQQQLVEIGRALSRHARVIVMDEPTATLTAHEFRLLVHTIEKLKASGVGIIFITHHLEEIFEICDDVTVMRDGRSVEVRAVSEWSEQTMIQAMVNRPIDKLFPKREITLGKVRLSVKDLASAGRFSGVSFEVRAGEVYGLAGLVGAGRTEILKALFGAVPVSQGEIMLEGRAYRPHSPRNALSHGIALVPEDRKAEGLLLTFPIKQNIALSTLRTLSRFRFILRPRAIQAQAVEAIRSLRIKAVSAGQEVRRLSGGNQQKVVLARVISVGPKVFLLDEPTRGIDVGAKIEVYTLIGDLAAKGAAVLVVSSDLLELIGLCDTIGVLRAGRKTGELDRTQFSQDRIMSLAAAG